MRGCCHGLRVRSPCPQPICHADFRDHNKPYFTNEEKAYFQSAMTNYLKCFNQSGKTCRGDANGLIDDVVNGCEVLQVGHEYTWHTHPCNTKPSGVDIASTKKLNRRYLCIGHAPSKKTICYDLAQGGKVVSVF